MLHCKTAVVTIALVNFIWFISDANAKSYNLFDLGLFQASSINDAGRIAGSYGGNAAIWNKGSVTLLENSFGFQSTASSISNTGFAVGNSFAMSGGDPRATVWIDGEARELEWGSSSYALAVNNSGHVVGESGAGINEGQHAYYWDGNNTTDLGTLGGKQSAAAGINDEGKVVGFSTISGNESEEHAVLWDSGVAVDLGGLGGANSYAFDINNRGMIVGKSETGEILPINGSVIVEHAALWVDGLIFDLGALGGHHSSFAWALNERGTIVGQSVGPLRRATLWNSEGMFDLNDLVIGDGSGWILEGATGINERGKIVGYGFNAAGERRNFLLSPVPLPPAISALGSGVGLISILCWRRKKKSFAPKP